MIRMVVPSKVSSLSCFTPGVGFNALGEVSLRCGARGAWGAHMPKECYDAILM